MPTMLEEAASGDTATIDTHDPPVNAGLSRSCIDAPHKLAIIDRVLVSGGTFLDRYLQLAVIEHCVVPGCGDQPQDAAVVKIQSLRILGRRVGMCNDTVGKYVLFFLALGLLYKRRRRDSIELYFPLHHYQLPTVTDLDQFFIDTPKDKYRHAVLRGAHAMRGRFALLYGNTSSPSSSASGETSTASRLLQCTREDLESILAAEGVDFQTTQRIVGKLKSLQPGHKARGLSDTGIDSDTRSSNTEHGLSDTGIDSGTTAKDQQDRLSHVGVDYKNASENDLSGFSETHVDSNTTPEPQQPSISSKNVDSDGDSASKRGLSTANVDSVAASVSPNVNVVITTLMETINVNVSPVAEFLRIAFHEEPRKRGYYHNLYKEHRNVDAWLAAALETLVGFHSTKTVKEPGRYFYDRCIALHQHIPSETADLVRTYGHLTYTQLLEVLTKPPVPPETAPRAAPTSRPAPHRQPLRLHIARAKEVPGMDRPELKALVTLITSTAATCGLLTQAYQQADGSCALLIDDGMQHSRQVWIYSLRDWQTRLAQMHTLVDLFSSHKKI